MRGKLRVYTARHDVVKIPKNNYIKNIHFSCDTGIELATPYNYIPSTFTTTMIEWETDCNPEKGLCYITIIMGGC